MSDKIFLPRMVLVPKSLVFIVGFFYLIGALNAAEFFIDPISGDDNASGKDTDSAWNSLGYAKKQIRAHLNEIDGDIIINLRGGIYNLETPLVFTAEDGGGVNRTVIWRAYENEKPVIQSSQKVTHWSDKDGNGIWEAAVESGALFRQLYIDGNKAVRCREPDQENTIDFGPYYQEVIHDFDNKRLRISAHNIREWEGFERMEIVVQGAWYHSYLRTESMIVDDPYDRYAFITVQQPERDRYFNQATSRKADGGAYHLENALVFLDTPGEWFLDTEENRLYYFPKEGENMESVEVIYPRLEKLVILKGKAQQPIRNLTFSGLTFQYTNWTQASEEGVVATQASQPRGYPEIMADMPTAAMEISYADKVTIDNCEFRKVGANGLSFVMGVKNSAIINSRFHIIAANAIHIDPARKMHPEFVDKCTKNIVANNEIFNFGQDYRSGMGIVASVVEDLLVEHNEIYWGPYSGMQIGNHHEYYYLGIRNNVIRNNYVHDVMRLLSDGGGIYVIGVPDSPENGILVNSNWVKNIRASAYVTPSWKDNVNGIYLDEANEYTSVESNVLENFGPNTILYKIHGGSKNKIKKLERESIDLPRTQDNIIINIDNVSQNDGQDKITLDLAAQNQSIKKSAGIIDHYSINQ